MSSIYLGLISGTSMDGVDIAAVSFDKNKTAILASATLAYDSSLASQLNNLINDYSQLNAGEIASLDAKLGLCYGRLINDFINQHNLDKNTITAIGSHGQTLFHQPPTDKQLGFTLQIGDPFRIAAQTGFTVVADFRRADIATGGHGAPLTPAFHQHCLSSANESRIIANLGGIANITLLQGKNVTGGFDTGPANTLMDSWCQQYLQLPYDKDGAQAKAGKINQALCETLLADSYFALAAPKSTGREYFNLNWLQHLANEQLAVLSHNDILASLCYLSAQSLSHACLTTLPDAQRLIICGGGSHNSTLLHMLENLLPFPVETSSLYNIDPDYVEAAAFAWFAKQRLANQPANLPQVTGAHKHCLLGIVVDPSESSAGPLR